MFLFQQMAPGAMAAMLVAAALCLAVRRFGWDKCEWLGAVPLGIGYACGHLIVTGWPGFPPKDATNWILNFALVAVPVGFIGACTMSARTRLGAAVALSIAALSLLLKPKFQYGWSPIEGVVWIVALAVLTVVHWLSLDLARRRGGNNGIEIVLLILMPSLGAGVALLLSGSIVLGQFGLVLTAAALGATLPGSRPLSPSSASLAAFAGIFSPLLVSGYFYAELPAGSALLLWATGPLVLICRATISARILALRIGAVLVCVVVAVVLAFRASPPLDY